MFTRSSIQINNVTNLIDETIRRICQADYTGDFSLETGWIFNDARLLLQKLKQNIEISDKDKLKHYDVIIFGFITLAMASTAGVHNYNGECNAPLTVYNLQFETKVFVEPVKQICEFDDFGSPIGEGYRYDEGYLELIEAVGRKMLDKTLPLFPTATLFSKHKISIEDLHSLKKMVEEKIPVEENNVDSPKLI